MKSFACVLAVGLALVAGAPTAIADARVGTELPVLAAVQDSGRVRVHLAPVVSGQTRAAMYRTLTVEGFDASGASIGVVSRIVPRRNNWASVTLTPALAGAERLTVTAK